MADGFTRPLPSVVVIFGYGLAFYCLSMALRTIPVGVAYAIWCGIGIVLVTAIAWVVYDQKLDPWALAAIGLIFVGTLMLNMPPHAGGQGRDAISPAPETPSTTACRTSPPRESRPPSRKPPRHFP